MLLVIDAGNTQITVGVYRDKTLLFQSRLATDRAKTEDQYAVDLMNLLHLNQTDPAGITGAILSSVVPPLNPILRQGVCRVTGVTPLLVGPGIKTGVDIRIDDPATLGADLLVGAAAAAERVGKPCIVWDLGTATTVSVVDKAGAYRGGAIMAGVGTALESLTARASQLNAVSLEPPARVVGTNTAACLRSGSIYGAAAMIDGMTERIMDELGYPAPVVMTGGLGKLIAAHCKTPVEYIDELLLDGLRCIYEKNA